MNKYFTASDEFGYYSFLVNDADEVFVVSQDATAWVPVPFIEGEEDLRATYSDEGCVIREVGQGVTQYE